MNQASLLQLLFWAPAIVIVFWLQPFSLLILDSFVFLMRRLPLLFFSDFQGDHSISLVSQQDLQAFLYQSLFTDLYDSLSIQD